MRSINVGSVTGDWLAEEKIFCHCAIGADAVQGSRDPSAQTFVSITPQG